MNSKNVLTVSVIIVVLLISVSAVIILLKPSKEQQSSVNKVTTNSVQDTNDQLNEVTDNSQLSEEKVSQTVETTSETESPVIDNNSAAEPVDNNAIGVVDFSFDGLESLPACLDIENADVQKDIQQKALSNNTKCTYVYFEYIDDTHVHCASYVDSVDYGFDMYINEDGSYYFE